MKVWIDLDNSPHVPFFKPIIGQLEQNGLQTLVTVRSFSQTEDLANKHGLQYHIVGRHRTHRYFATRAGATIYRAAQLANFVRKHNPDVAVSHGSRGLVLASRMLGIPSITLYDYEFVSARIFNRLSRRVLAPEIISRERLETQGLDLRKFTAYPGLKEDVYIHDFEPDPAVLEELGLDPERLIVAVRPQANWTHYHNDHSEVLFCALIEKLRQEREAQVVIMPRTDQQRIQLIADYRLDQPPFRLVDHAVDGLSLMWYSDAVFSGGGTMVREAALWGVKIYSTFAGRLGAADQQLAADGKLVLIRDPRDLDRVIISKRKPLLQTKSDKASETRDFICKQIVDFAGSPNFGSRC
jgi:hypothetical protein